MPPGSDTGAIAAKRRRINLTLLLSWVATPDTVATDEWIIARMNDDR
jgi:hypothetical protein